MSPKADSASNLTPGGYVELQEMNTFITSDNKTLTEDYSLSKWIRIYIMY